jgi:hypothetical protein
MLRGDHYGRASAALLAAALAVLPLHVDAQGRSNSPPVYPHTGTAPSYTLEPGAQRSSNVTLMGHVPLGGFLHTADIEIEQDLSRPYAYV